MKNSNLPSPNCFINLFPSSVHHSHDSLGEYASKEKTEEGKALLFPLPAVVLQHLPKFLGYIPAT